MQSVDWCSMVLPYTIGESIIGEHCNALLSKDSLKPADTVCVSSSVVLQMSH